MSNYTKTTDFAAKDALSTGDPLKVVRGTEIDAEFVAIATAISSKANTVSPTFTGTPLAPTPDGNTATQIANVSYVDAQAYASVPIGAIIMWGGAAGNYPAGWELCDGSTYPRSDGNGNITTPDLRNRFIVAYGSGYTEYETGGSTSHTHTATNAGSHNHGGTTGSHALTAAQIPAHTHGVLASSAEGNSRALGDATCNGVMGANGASNSTLTNTGSGGQILQNTGSGEGHTHTVGTDGDHSHTINAGTHVPPYIALAFLMKV